MAEAIGTCCRGRMTGPAVTVRRPFDAAANAWQAIIDEALK
jgi:hypothetical protein